ncbi:MAG: molybdopterin-dependent oxidoreductase [Oscillospiraceae bacterium]|nr:molybdopterin-dependent oxidoreductase [Oscillospiraceae bacterium]
MSKQNKDVSRGVRKVDSMALVTGQPVYTDDMAPKDCLIVKLLRSPHANAKITGIRTETAKRVPGIACVLTYADVPHIRYTHAGQTYPETSPYDRYILEDRVRFVGDAVAIVAGETEEAVDRALKLIQVDYQVLPAVLDFHTAKDNPILVHPEEDWLTHAPFTGADNRRNLLAHDECFDGDVEAVLQTCDEVIDQTYRVQAAQQVMMETFRTYCYKDPYGRLVMTSSTQVPFHVRRIISTALGIPKSKVRVIKPRIGGGFGAKQTVVSEPYPAIVTWLTGKPAKIVYSRYEAQTSGSPRHQMEMHVRLGAMRDGTIRGIYLHTLSDGGAYGEHSWATVGLSGHKSIPLYGGNCEAFRFDDDVVYTNHQASGAYRGFGATQGIFAVESAVNELSRRLGIDPTVIRSKNMVREGQTMPAYYNEPLTSCTLDRCMERCKEMADWEHKYPYRVLEDGTIRAVGVAMAMQGSGISGVDVGTVTLRVNDDGIYTLMVGCSDMGTGCDTILSQIAADCLDCDMSQITVHGVDTDVSPYDSGSYASSTTYVTGRAVVDTCAALEETIIREAARQMGCAPENLSFDWHTAVNLETGQQKSLGEIANDSQNAGNFLTATKSYSSPTSPTPFMVGIAEVDIDPETGKVTPVNYYGCIDCGTVINPNLARVQAEGGIVQAIGMTLYEDITQSETGKCYSNSLMQYKIPTRLDMGNIFIDFASSYEPTGPFGAKSIGELVIDTPAPAIAAAVAEACGQQFRILPIRPEQVCRVFHPHDL